MTTYDPQRFRGRLGGSQTGRALADRLALTVAPVAAIRDRSQSNDQDAHLRRERALVATTGGYSNDGDPNA